MSEEYNPSFVAKAGFLNAPMVGWFAETLFNCVAVDNAAEVAAAAAAVGTKAAADATRTSAEPAKRVAGATVAIAARLRELVSARRQQQSSAPLAVFCEGTTSNGDYLINYRTGVFRAAAAAMGDADADESGPPAVHCMVLRYPHRHFAPAWESIFVTTHILRLLTQFTSTLEAEYLPPVQLRAVLPVEGAAAAVTEARAVELATGMRRYMSAQSHPPLPAFEAGAAEKAAFHAWLGPRMVALSARERLIYTHPPNAVGRRR